MSKFDNQIPIRNVFTVILDSKKISTTASTPAPPIGDSSLIHVMRHAAHLTASPTPMRLFIINNPVIPVEFHT
jgi:hypothetical protein